MSDNNTNNAVYPTTRYDSYNQGLANNNPPQTSLEKPVTVGEWMLTMLILGIPLVGFIMVFVWAFGSGTAKSKANYFKAYLIWTAIITGLYILLLVFLFAILGMAFSDMFSEWW